MLTTLWCYCSILFVVLLIPFGYEDKRLANIEQRTMMHPLTSGIYESNTHLCMLKADILNTWRKLACVENKEIAFLVNTYHD